MTLAWGIIFQRSNYKMSGECPGIPGTWLNYGFFISFFEHTSFWHEQNITISHGTYSHLYSRIVTLVRFEFEKVAISGTIFWPKNCTTWNGSVKTAIFYVYGNIEIRRHTGSRFRSTFRAAKSVVSCTGPIDDNEAREMPADGTNEQKTLIIFYVRSGDRIRRKKSHVPPTLNVIAPLPPIGYECILFPFSRRILCSTKFRVKTTGPVGGDAVRSRISIGPNAWRQNLVYRRRAIGTKRKKRAIFSTLMTAITPYGVDHIGNPNGEEVFKTGTDRSVVRQIIVLRKGGLNRINVHSWDGVPYGRTSRPSRSIARWNRTISRTSKT